MADPFSGLRLDYTNRALQELTTLLAENLYHADAIFAIAKGAGVDHTGVPASLGANLIWRGIFTAAHNQMKVDPLFEQVVLAMPKVGRFVKDLRSNEPHFAVNLKPDSAGNWRGGNQRLTGDESALLPVGFLDEGIVASKNICLVTAYNENKHKTKPWSGTGFLVEPDLVVTNHHVLWEDEGKGPKAGHVTLTFDYEKGKKSFDVEGLPDTIVGDPDFDCAAIRLEKPVPNVKGLTLGSCEQVHEGDPAFIIQHPAGVEKHVALYNNEIRFKDNKYFHYLTDTLGGSSGSPVMNKNWEVIALHHQWVESDDPKATRHVRNKGVRIREVVDALKKLGVKFNGQKI